MNRNGNIAEDSPEGIPTCVLTSAIPELVPVVDSPCHPPTEQNVVEKESPMSFAAAARAAKHLQLKPTESVRKCRKDVVLGSSVAEIPLPRWSTVVVQRAAKCDILK